MASWTTPVIHSTGDILAVSDWNGVANNETFLYQAPYANYFNSSSTTLTNTTIVQVTLGGTTCSGYGFSVTSGENVIVPLAGTYLVSGGVQITLPAGSGSDYFLEFIYHNGVGIANGSTTGSFTGAPISTGSTIVKCSASDSLGLYAYQNSGTNLATTAAAASTFLSAFFVGSQ